MNACYINLSRSTDSLWSLCTQIDIYILNGLDFIVINSKILLYLDIIFE